MPDTWPLMIPPKMGNMVQLCLLLITILISSAVSELCNCNPQDKQVLLQIKQDLNNPYLLASWNPNTDCCDWYTVACGPNTHRINSLTLFSDNRPGQIPPSVGQLPNLETLEFRKLPKLVGRIQPTIANLTNLKFLRLSYTGLSGPIPAFLAELKNLTFLDLSFNFPSGAIPPELSLLPNLNAIHLDHNYFSWSIPISFGSFKNAPDLYLSHNNLSGLIPASLGYLDFNVIDLSWNSLGGDASMLFGTSKTTQIIDLSRNLLEFNLTNVVFSTSLTSLDLSHNKIYGSLSEELTELNLQFLNVSYNMLCGQIPVGGKLQAFDIHSYVC